MLLLGILILIFIGFYAHKEYTQLKISVSPQTTPPQAQLALIDFIKKNISGKENILDIGSGWGTMLFHLSSELPQHLITGIEFSLTPWLVSQFRSLKAANPDKVSLLKGDAHKIDIRPYGLVYCNLPPVALKAIVPKLRKELSSGAYIVTLNHPIDGLEHFKAIQTHDNPAARIYVYKNINTFAHASASAASTQDSRTKQTLQHYKGGIDFPTMLVLGNRGMGKTAPYPEDKPIAPYVRSFPAENSYEACLKALQDGADGIEIDVILSKDGELIVCHDDNLSLHMTHSNIQAHGSPSISTSTYEQLRTIPIGYGGFKLATLDEILSLVVKYDAYLNIELKGKNTAIPTLKHIHTYARDKHLDKAKIIISSFDHAQLKTVRDNDADIKIGLLFEVKTKESQPLYPEEPGSPYSQHFSSDYIDRIAPAVRPFSLHVTANNINDDLIAAMSAHKLHSFIWWIDEPTPDYNEEFLGTMFHLKRANMPFHMITDYPETLSGLMQLENISKDASLKTPAPTAQQPGPEPTQQEQS